MVGFAIVVATWEIHRVHDYPPYHRAKPEDHPLAR